MNQNLLPIITPVKIHHTNRAHLCKFQKLWRVDVQVDNTKLKVTLAAAPVINCKVVISQKALLLTLSLPYVCGPKNTEHRSYISTQYGCFCSCLTALNFNCRKCHTLKEIHNQKESRNPDFPFSAKLRNVDIALQLIKLRVSDGLDTWRTNRSHVPYYIIYVCFPKFSVESLIFVGVFCNFVHRLRFRRVDLVSW